MVKALERLNHLLEMQQAAILFLSLMMFDPHHEPAEPLELTFVSQHTPNTPIVQ
jgi:hypothetical protein